MAELRVLRGLPASGKTTYARSWVKESPEERVRVNRDDLRAMLHPGLVENGVIAHERALTKARDALTTQLLKQGLDVVVDDTNLKSRYVRDLKKISDITKSGFNIVDFTDVPLVTCLNRDSERLHPAGADAIQGMYNRYLKGRPYPLPIGEEPEEAVLETYVPDKSLRKAFIVDIDGTLAQKSNRSPFDWHRVSEDTLKEEVAQVVTVLWREGYEIVFLSGRDSVCYEATDTWIQANVPGVKSYELFMRPEKDMRKDSTVKYELFRENVSSRYHVVGVFDDRNQVVQMWRDIGLTCFQVAPGDF